MRHLAEDAVLTSTSTATLASAVKAMVPIAENFLPSVDPIIKQMHPDDSAAGFIVANMRSRELCSNPSAASDQPRAFLRLIEEACPLLEPQIKQLCEKLSAETADREADRGGTSEAASEVLGVLGGAGIFRDLGVGFLQPPAQMWSPGAGAGHCGTPFSGAPPHFDGPPPFDSPAPPLGHSPFGVQPPPDDGPDAKKQRTVPALGKATSELVRNAPKHDLDSAKRAALKHLNERCTGCGFKRQRSRCPNNCAGHPLHPDLQNAGSAMKPE